MLTQAPDMSTTVSKPPQNTQLRQADTPRGPFSSRSEGQKLEGVTQVHATAVNGDKQTLSRLLAASLGDVDVGDQFGRSPLMYCVLADRLECAEILIKAGALVNLRDKGGRTALHWAAHKGNLRLMKLLLSRGADCREKDNEGQTALHLCTRHKLPKCMAILLRQLTPGEIDDQDKNKRTALHWAASYGNLEHVKMLIKQDSNIGIPDTEGKTPLHWAASSRDREAVSCVKLILETTPSVIDWQDYEGRTALHLAVADGNESVVNVLTSVKNCNVSALDNVFRTPLHWAAVLGHSKIVSILLESGADSASSDANGATALHYAAQNNYSDTVSVFLTRNCTDEVDLEGRSAFMWAAGKGADDVVKVYLEHNVDIQQEDKTGGTALHAAALSGHSSTVKLLLDNRARLEVTDQAKHTPLFRACEMGQMDVVQTLIDCGARVDVLDQDGRSPLHWAALGGHAYICQMLIKYGVHPNIRDHSARTPLHCAAYGGYVNCMSALMEHGAEPNSQDKEGMTCLHWACSKGHLDAVKLLIEYNAFPNHMEFTEDRYTPLDYALMGEHHDVAQYMIEQGALSITGIQDIAAQKIQSAFRGYRVRKAFIERKKLLMKHEKLKKEAARKRAAEEGKKSGDDQTLKKTDTAISVVQTAVDSQDLQQQQLQQQQVQHDASALPSPKHENIRDNEERPQKTEKLTDSKSDVHKGNEKYGQNEHLHQQQQQQQLQQQVPGETDTRVRRMSRRRREQNFGLTEESQHPVQQQQQQQQQSSKQLHQHQQKQQDKQGILDQQNQQKKPAQMQLLHQHLAQPPEPEPPPAHKVTSLERTLHSDSDSSSKHSLSKSSRSDYGTKLEEDKNSVEQRRKQEFEERKERKQKLEERQERKQGFEERPERKQRLDKRQVEEEQSPKQGLQQLRQRNLPERMHSSYRARHQAGQIACSRHEDEEQTAVVTESPVVCMPPTEYRKFKGSREEILFHYTSDRVHRKRLRATQEEWERQIAALTIQLAWRKFYRRKLLRSFHPNRRQLLMWDPEIVALKQQALVHYIYNEQIQAPFWHPTLKPAVRPLWTRFVPSAAAVSYNFAVDQYVPWVARLGAQPQYPASGHQPRFGDVSASLSSDSRPVTRSGGGSKANSRGSNGTPETSSNRVRTSAAGNRKSSKFSYNLSKKS